MHDLLGRGEELEAPVQDGDELEAQHGLHARQQHARLVGGVGGLLLEQLVVSLHDRS